MNVLVACEESQEVCKAFREKGHRAFSCDLQECSGGHSEWHIHGDVLPILNGDCTFQTADTHTHTNRAVGSYHRTPTMYRSCCVRCKMVPGKAERLSAAEIMRIFHVFCTCTLRPDCC